MQEYKTKQNKLQFMIIDKILETNVIVRDVNRKTTVR